MEENKIINGKEYLIKLSDGEMVKRNIEVCPLNIIDHKDYDTKITYIYKAKIDNKTKYIHYNDIFEITD